MSWPSAKLGDLLKVKHGFAFKGEFFESAGDKLVLTPGNFKIGGGLQLRSGKERYYSGIYPQEFALQPGDLLVAMTDLTQGAPILGLPLVIPAEGSYLHNQRLGKLIDIDERVLDRGFAYYLFVWDGVRAQLRASATGATVRHTAPERIYRVLVPLPPLATQRKVAAILSTCDDLIENNSRRIKLLEEMAQRIYREWFVDFRYPGHESVPLVDSNLGPIPWGWITDALGTVVKVNALTAKSLSSFDMIHYIDISSVERGSVTERKRVAAVDAPGRARRLVRDGDVIWSTVRPNLRAYALMLDPPSSCVVSTGFAVLSPEWVPFAFLYGLSATDSFVGYLTNHATGSAYPAVTGRTFAEMPIVIPDADLLQRYSTIAEPMLRLSSRLQEAQSILRDTRDLLLPRLISGDIDVDELNIEVPDAA